MFEFRHTVQFLAVLLYIKFAVKYNALLKEQTGGDKRKAITLISLKISMTMKRFFQVVFELLP